VLEKGINGDMITIYDKGAHIPLLWTHLIPATVEGKALHNVQNAMFAAAIAYSFDTSLENIRQGLRIFNTSFYQAPGRLNIYDELPFKVILDYAHNPAAIATITDLAKRLDVNGKRRIVMAMPGDRRDEDVAAVANITARGFDRFICKADDDRRGRGIDEANIQVIPSEENAVEQGLKDCKKGDLLIILGDNITRCWKQIVHFNSDIGTDNHDEKPSEDFPEKLFEHVEHKFELNEGESLVHDERGVRLVVEHDEDSD
jgi:cyanophycin synthetase